MLATYAQGGGEVKDFAVLALGIVTLVAVVATALWLWSQRD